MLDRAEELLAPMSPENWETTSSRRGKLRSKNTWKRPTRLSGFDFTFDQIPAIFSGYTAGSEDSSSSEMSDASGSYSRSVGSSHESQEIEQVRSIAVKRRLTLKRMKSISRIPSMKLRRQLTRNFLGGTETRQRLKKVRSVKRKNSLLRRNSKSMDDQSSKVLSVEATGLTQPHYLRPTSSSSLKKAVQIRKNPNHNLGSMGKRLFGCCLSRSSSLRPSRKLTKMVSMRNSRKKNLRISPFQDSSLLRATCSSALKESKFADDVSGKKVCRYMYCSVHGHHSHTDDVNVPSLKRFVSMRRRLLKTQKSMKRSKILLKRSLSRRRGSRTGQFVTCRDADTADQELGQVDVAQDGEWNKDFCEERVSCSENRISGNDSETKSRSPENRDLGMVGVGEKRDGSSFVAFGTNATPQFVLARKRWEDLQMLKDESEVMAMDETKCRTVKDTPKDLKLWRLIYQHMVADLGHEVGNPGAIKDKETTEDTEIFCSEGSGSCRDRSGVVQDRVVWEDSQKTEHDRSNAVKLVKQAFDEIFSEIPDYTSDNNSITWDKTWDHEDLIGENDRGLKESIVASCNSEKFTTAQDADFLGIASASNIGEESSWRVRKNWTYARKVILLERIIKSLENLRSFDQRESRHLSGEPEQEVAEMMNLRHQPVGERENEQEWMLDYALRQVISTLAPSQKRKVELLGQAFETIFPTVNVTTHPEFSSRSDAPYGNCGTACTSSYSMNSGEAESGRICLETNLSENKDEAADIQVTEQLGLIYQDNTLDLDSGNGRDHTETEVASEVPAVSNALTLDEAVESLTDGSLCDSYAVRVRLDGSGSYGEEEKRGNSGSGTKSEKQILIKWRNLIYKHMVMGMSAKDESKSCATKKEHVDDNSQLGSTDGSTSFECYSGANLITGEEDDGDAADSHICAVKLVQQAFEKILSEIPDQSFDQETASTFTNSGKDTTVEEKEDFKRQGAAKGWNSLRKVILLKKFVKSLEKAQNCNPRKLRHLPMEPEMEAEKFQLRHRWTGPKKNTEELMLDYSLRQVISKLAPSQRRKVALLVQAFDTVLDGGEQVRLDPDDEACADSATSVSGETGKEDFPPHYSLVEVCISETILKPDKGKESDFNTEDQRISDKFLGVQVMQRDLKEEEGHSVVSESSFTPPCISDVKRRIMMEKEKDAKLWNLIYQHMVTGPKRETMEGESIAVMEDETHDEGHLKIKTSSSGTVKLVREALEKILSEIPDHSSDGQSVGSDITTEQELFERHSEARQADVATEAHPDMKARDVSFKQKLEPKPEHETSKKSLKGWSNLKKVILLRRFVNELSSLTKPSPRNSLCPPPESDPEAEKIHMRHHSPGGRKSSEEWMIDYALRQVISTLEPSQRRKVAFLAQAFDTISLQETGGCWSPNSAASPHISRRSSTSSLFQSENEACSESGEARSLEKSGDSGSREASVGITYPTNELPKWGSGYNNPHLAVVSFQGRKRDTIDKENLVVPRNETDDSGYCLEDDGENSTQRARNLQEGEENKLDVSTTGANDGNMGKQQCMSLWRLLCKQMELGVTEKEQNQPLLDETSKEEEKNDNAELENQDTDSEKMELYQCEAVKLLGEAIDEIPLPGTQDDDDDSRDNRPDNGNTVPDQKFLTAQEDSKTEQETKTEQMQNKRNGWSSIKRVIILKRFVKALEKVQKFNPKEPQFLPLKPDPETEKVHLRHQETQNKKNGEEWMLDYALQDVVAKLTPARKRKVQLLVQAFETVIPATGN